MMSEVCGVVWRDVRVVWCGVMSEECALGLVSKDNLAPTIRGFQGERNARGQPSPSHQLSGMDQVQVWDVSHFLPGRCEFASVSQGIGDRKSSIWSRPEGCWRSSEALPAARWGTRGLPPLNSRV